MKLKSFMEVMDADQAIQCGPYFGKPKDVYTEMCNDGLGTVKIARVHAKNGVIHIDIDL